MIQSMMKVSHTLIQSCRAVQYTAGLYNLAQDNVSPVNPLNCLEGYVCTNPLLQANTWSVERAIGD